MHALVLGAGIAGLSAAHALLTRGARVTVLEREALPFSHSSGRNAAIYRPLELGAGIPVLARRSATLYDALLGSRSAWLDRRGLWLVAASEQALEPLRTRAIADDVAHRISTELPDVLRGGRARVGLHLADAGVLDPHAIGQALSAAVRAAGGVLRTNTPVARIVAESDRVTGVRLDDGEALPADAVIIAGGAWAAALAETAGAPLPLTPIRRHLVQLTLREPLAPRAPTVWDVELEAYFRPESGGVLASPCDETPWPAELPAADPAALELLSTRLTALAPRLSTSSSVVRSWACLRTFAPDRAPVVGPDARVHGLHWVAALGGFGMSTGIAAGELCARGALGDVDDALLSALSPIRLDAKKLVEVATDDRLDAGVALGG